MYIVHLPVLTLITWFVVRLPVGVGVKYGVLVGATLAASFAVFESVRRVGVLRFLLGMKAGVRASAVAGPTHAGQTSSAAGGGM